MDHSFYSVIQLNLLQPPRADQMTDPDLQNAHHHIQTYPQGSRKQS